MKDLPLQVYPRSFYHETINEANNVIGQTDLEDIDILALALQFNTYLWTQDKHFEKISDKIHVLKTENLL